MVGKILCTNEVECATVSLSDIYIQQVQGSILGGVVNFHLKVFNLGARRDGDVHFLIARLYVTGLD